MSNTQDELFERLKTVFSQEVYIGNNFEAIPVSKFKIYDDLIDDYFLEEKTEHLNLVEDHFKNYNSSVSARYILGIIYLSQNKIDQKLLFDPLFIGFRHISKWNIVEHIADRVLEFIQTDLNILEYKIEALEKQKKNQELKSTLHILIKIDKKNPNHLKKYGLAIADEKPEESLDYIKKSIIIYLNQGKYEEFENIWPRFYKNLNNHDNIAYIEKIEKIIVRNKNHARLPVYLYPVLDIYKNQKKWEQVIFICKKILEHQSDSNKARIDLIKSYKIKYKSHSLLNDFLKHSELGNHKKSVLQCIQSFERNIVFDVNNYVSHRNWKVGKIVDISSQDTSIIVDFYNKKKHKFSIEMAIKSLKPIKKEHIWVLIHENRDLILDQFQSNPIEIVEAYVKSFNGSILVSDLKQEIISNKFLESPSQWTKWWLKTTNLIKKHHHLVFDLNKKNKINYREKKLTFVEKQEEKFFFLSDNDLEKRLEIVLKVLDDVSADNQEDYLEKIEIFSNYFASFLEQCKNYEETFSFENGTLDELINNNLFITNIIKKFYIYIYFIKIKKIYNDFSQNKDETPDMEYEKEILKNILLKFGIEKEFLLKIFGFINSIEVKKKIIEIIPDILNQNEEQSYRILSHLIFDKSVKISKSVFNLLLKNSQYEILKQVLKQILKDFKNYPDIFLTIISILLIHKEKTKKNTTKEDKRQDFQNYLNANSKDKLTQKDLLLQVFRILKTVDKVETQGTKLKNMISSIIDPENLILLLILKEANEQYLRKIYVLYKEVSFLPDWKKQEFYNLISKIRGGRDQWWIGFIYQNSNENKQKNALDNKILVTQKVFDKKKEELYHLINIEMPANSKDIGEAQEKGDLRENAEYKAAMEKQNQLQKQIKDLESSLKKTDILDISKVDTNEVNIGCTLKLKDLKNKKVLEYSILGIWDADTEKNIISYESLLAKALIGKKIGERAILFSSNNQKEYEIIEIQSYKE